MTLCKFAFLFIYLFNFYLHDGVICRDVVGEQVKVPGGKDKGKQHLRFPRDACRGGIEREQQVTSSHNNTLNCETLKIRHQQEGINGNYDFCLHCKTEASYVVQAVGLLC